MRGWKLAVDGLGVHDEAVVLLDRVCGFWHKYRMGKIQWSTHGLSLRM
jgi:hypothetical protein